MNLRDQIRSDADLCVKCGLCLPHCPTYGQALDEAESPRGRIALMQALAEGALEPQGRLALHIDRCLGCRACERVCPSRVEYGRLLESGRALIAGSRTTQPAAAVIEAITSGRMSRWAGLLRFYQRSGLGWLARRTGLLRALGLARAEAMLPPLESPARWKEYYPPAGAERGRIGLFTGCLGDMLDQQAVNAGIALLNACGYGVHVPRQQACCGALARHAGDRAGAEALARRNLDAFGSLAIEAIAYVASGCGATLVDYARDGRCFGVPVSDLCTLLDGLEWPDGISLRPLEKRVVVHDPCSLRNVARAAGAPYRLLRRVPGLDVRPLAGNDRCCGGAGAYVLTQPATADALRADKLAALTGSNADILVTSNLGCALHIAAGARAAGMGIEVMHPVTLIGRQLGRLGTLPFSG